MEIKKNAVDLTDLAVGILILGIVVTIGASVLVNLRDNQLTDLTVSTTSNETLTGSNTTGTELSATWFKDVTLVTNTTGGETVGAGNYSVTTGPTGIGTFTVVGSQYNGEGLNVTYQTYDTTSRADWTLSNNAATGLAEYGNWFDIIVIVGVAAVILSLIFLAFGNRESGFAQAY